MDNIDLSKMTSISSLGIKYLCNCVLSKHLQINRNYAANIDSFKHFATTCNWDDSLSNKDDKFRNGDVSSVLQTQTASCKAQRMLYECSMYFVPVFRISFLTNPCGFRIRNTTLYINIPNVLYSEAESTFFQSPKLDIKTSSQFKSSYRFAYTIRDCLFHT